MAKRSAAGSYLGEVLDGKKAQRKTGAKPVKAKKLRFTVNLDPEVIEQVRDAVGALAGPPARLTLSSLVEQAVRAEVAKLEKRHNSGEAFPKRDYELRAGRPPSR